MAVNKLVNAMLSTITDLRRKGSPQGSADCTPRALATHTFWVSWANLQLGSHHCGVPGCGSGIEVLPPTFHLLSYLEQREAARVRTQARAEMTQPT